MGALCMLRRQRRAFTLIELVMTMSIIGILAALSYPRVTQSYYIVKLAGAARQVQTQVRYAQQMALNQHAKYDVVFDTANECYRVADVAAGINVTDPFSRVAGVSGQDWSTGLYVDFVNNKELGGINISSTTSATLRFASTGHPTDTSDVDLTANFDIVLTYQNNTRTVRVTPYTGVVTVF